MSVEFFNYIPPEILKLIASFEISSFSETERFSLVCKRFYEILKDCPPVWKNLMVERWGESCLLPEATCDFRTQFINQLKVDIAFNPLSYFSGRRKPKYVDEIQILENVSEQFGWLGLVGEVSRAENHGESWFRGDNIDIVVTFRSFKQYSITYSVKFDKFIVVNPTKTEPTSDIDDKKENPDLYRLFTFYHLPKERAVKFQELKEEEEKEEKVVIATEYNDSFFPVFKHTSKDILSDDTIQPVEKLVTPQGHKNSLMDIIGGRYYHFAVDGLFDRNQRFLEDAVRFLLKLEHVNDDWTSHTVTTRSRMLQVRNAIKNGKEECLSVEEIISFMLETGITNFKIDTFPFPPHDDKVDLTKITRCGSRVYKNSVFDREVSGSASGVTVGKLLEEDEWKDKMRPWENAFCFVGHMYIFQSKNEPGVIMDLDHRIYEAKFIVTEDKKIILLRNNIFFEYQMGHHIS